MKTLLLTAALAVALAGCQTHESGSVYSRHEAGREQSVRFATVDSVRHVKIAGGQSQVGPIAGGAVGGIAGSTVGHGKGSAVGAVLGAVGGGVAGSALRQAATRKPAPGIHAKLDSGELAAVAPEAD